MDIYSLSRKYWDFSFENPEKINPWHSAIYFFSIEHCNRLWWKQKFWFPSQMVMEAVWIRNWKTYTKYLNDLVEWGFIEIIEKSKNQYSSNIIAIVKNTKATTKATTKALDKALSKHKQKHNPKHSQSTASIDIQDYNTTNIQDYNIVVATKVATLETYIKKEFSLEFITQVYNKYWMTKDDFQEECESFVNYWKEKSPNWKKERWEKEKTFDPKLRFKTWMKNNKKWSNRVMVNSDDEERKQKLRELEERKKDLFNNI